MDSGDIYCNNHKIHNNEYKKYDIGTEIRCEAKTNNFFPPIQFASWSIIPPMNFESWTSDLTSDSKDKPRATFETLPARTFDS